MEIPVGSYGLVSGLDAVARLELASIGFILAVIRIYWKEMPVCSACY